MSEEIILEAPLGSQTDPPPIDYTKRLDEFEDEVGNLINRLSLENLTDTPEFILARYVRQSFEAFCKASNSRMNWYDEESTLYHQYSYHQNNTECL